MQTYKSKTRTVLSETADLPMCGIYILAYMGRVVYVGKATSGIAQRLEQHIENRLYELLGYWMYMLQMDWVNIRLDVLEAPDDGTDYWLREAEARLIRRFNPLFNVMNMA